MTAPLHDTFERAFCVPVVEESQVGAARRRAAGLADALGLGDTERGRVGIRDFRFVVGEKRMS